MDFNKFLPTNSFEEDELCLTRGQLVDIQTIQNLINKGLRTSQIALELNLSPRQITTFKNHRGMQQCRTSKLVLTEIEEQVVLGSILGDGCIEVNNRERGYYRLSIKHGEAQREYVWYKYHLLKRISKEPIEKFKPDKREKFKGGNSVNLRTTTNEVFKEYRERWYPNEKKEVNQEDLLKLSNLGLAIWIMDDGYSDGSGLMLSTDCFNNNSIELLVDFFSKNCIKTTVQKGNRIRIRKESMELLRYIIEPYMHPSLVYKVRVKECELLEKLEAVNQQPRLDGNTSKVQRLDKVAFLPIGNGEISTSAFQLS